MFRVADARESLEERREPLQQIFSAKKVQKLGLTSFSGHPRDSRNHQLVVSVHNNTIVFRLTDDWINLNVLRFLTMLQGFLHKNLPD
jgi:hypothetical protein